MDASVKQIKFRFSGYYRESSWVLTKQREYVSVVLQDGFSNCLFPVGETHLFADSKLVYHHELNIKNKRKNDYYGRIYNRKEQKRQLRAQQDRTISKHIRDNIKESNGNRKYNFASSGLYVDL